MKGQTPYAGQFAQFIDEDTPGTYNPAGVVNILTCLKIDFQPDEAWDSFRPDGVSEDAWHAMSKEWRVATAAVRWDYAQTAPLLEMALGFGVALSPAPAGAGEVGFALPAFGSRDIKVRTLEWGTPSNCERCPYCFITAISHNCDRDGASVDGQITFMCRKPVAVGVPMTGQAPASAVLNVAAANVSTDGIFSAKAGSNAAQNVTFSVGDTTAQTIAKFAAVGLTVAVAGTVAIGAGETHTLTGSNLVANQNATIYGTVVVNPSTSTPSSVQAAIRALGGSFALRTVSGTITAPITGTITKISVSGCSDATFNGVYSTDGTLNGQPTYANATGRFIYYSGNWYMSNAKGSASPLPPSFFRSTANGPIGPYIVNNGTESAPTAAISESTGGTPGAVALIIPVPVGEGNVADIEANPGTGYTGTSTPPGGAGGNIAITVIAPANTPVTLVKGNGANWASSITQPGTDGKIRIPKRVPMLPSHFGVRIAETRGALATAPLCQGVKKLGWSIDGLAEAVFFAQEGETTFQAHSDDPEGRKTGWDLLVAANSPLFATLLAKSKQSPSEPTWIELREVYAAGITLAKWQGYVAVSAPRKRQAGGKILAQAFTLTPVLDDAPYNENVASLISDGGASFYAAIRNAA